MQQYYTITEVSEKLGIERPRIKRLVKSGKIKSIKGKELRSPYKILQTEIEKICEIFGIAQAKAEEVELNTVERKANRREDRYYEEFMEMQKLLAETMRDLASTQEQVASTIAHLVKKV